MPWRPPSAAVLWIFLFETGRGLIARSSAGWAMTGTMREQRPKCVHSGLCLGMEARISYNFCFLRFAFARSIPRSLVEAAAIDAGARPGSPLL